LFPSFRRFLDFFLKKILKFTKSCKNKIYLQEMFVISLSSCSGLYDANFTESVFAIYDSPLHILRSVRMTTYEQWTIAMRPRLLINFRLRYSAFLSPGVNNRAELVPSPGTYARKSGSRSCKFFSRRQSGSSFIIGRIIDPRPGLRTLSIDPFVPCVIHWFTIYPSLHVLLLGPRV
jgi:hypothetical protein